MDIDRKSLSSLNFSANQEKSLQMEYSVPKYKALPQTLLGSCSLTHALVDTQHCKE